MSLAHPEDVTGRRLLLTPGPLSTSESVRAAMGIDIGSWDVDCIDLVRDIRADLLALAPASEERVCTLLQGSGSYGVEATLGCAVPDDGKLLILSNGAYGQRMRLSCEASRIPHTLHADPEERPHEPDEVERLLAADPSITHVSVVHGETTTGILNPVREIGRRVQAAGKRFIVDAISTFGSYPVGPGEALDLDAGPVDHLVGTANKCIEGAPGFAFIISRRGAIEAMEGRARSLCLDLHAQWSYMERTGQFRFTPPTHVLLGFRQALRELEAEGGPSARGERYAASHRTLVEGMERLGFEAHVAPEHRSHIITAFHYPEPDFDFSDFYRRLHARGYIIYPGKLSEIDTFRIANIGQLDAEDIEGLIEAIAAVRADMRTAP